MWKSLSVRVFHDPDRKSRHQANALPLVSRSTSSVLPSRKDSASESSSQLAANRGLWVLNALSLTTSVLLFSSGGPVSSVVTVGIVLKTCSRSVKPKSPSPLLATFLLDCIVSFWAKSKEGLVWNVDVKRQADLAGKHSWPVKLLNRKSRTQLDGVNRIRDGW